MKKLLIIIVLFFLLISCNSKNAPEYKETEFGLKYHIMIVDSCEYLSFFSSNGYAGERISHKGNCKFCAERQRKILINLRNK